MIINKRKRTVTSGGVEYGPFSYNQWVVITTLHESQEPVETWKLSKILYGDEEHEGGVRSLVNRIREMAKEAGAPDPINTILGHGYVLSIDDE